jgi:hypothetical protein
VSLNDYDRRVLSLHPALYLRMDGQRSGVERDLATCRADGTYRGGVAEPVRMPNGDPAALFDGTGDLEVPADRVLSISTTGALTIEAWIRPSTLRFAHTVGSGYVYWLGKGRPGQHEYALRMYSQGNREDRANRISGYAFNPAGGKGAGAYFQDPVVVNHWIMVDVVFNTTRTAELAGGSASIYKDGVLRQTRSLSELGVTPVAGGALLRIGTRNNESFFEGAIGKVAFYAYELTAQQIGSTYQAMTDEDPGEALTVP